MERLASVVAWTMACVKPTESTDPVRPCSASVVEALQEIAGAGGNRAALLGAARRAASGLLALRAAAGPPATTSALRKVGALPWGGSRVHKKSCMSTALVTSSGLVCADTQRWAHRS